MDNAAKDCLFVKKKTPQKYYYETEEAIFKVLTVNPLLI